MKQHFKNIVDSKFTATMETDNLLFLSYSHLIPAALFQTEHLAALFEQGRAVAALGTFIRNGRIPCRRQNELGRLDKRILR